MRHVLICATLSLATCLSPLNTYAAADIMPVDAAFQTQQNAWQQFAFVVLNEMSGNNPGGEDPVEALGEQPNVALQLLNQPFKEMRAQLFNNPYLASIFVDRCRDMGVTWDLRVQCPTHNHLQVLYELMEKWVWLTETIEDVLCGFYKKAFEGADTFAPTMTGEGVPDFNAGEAKTNILAHLKNLERQGGKIGSKLYGELLLKRMNTRHEIMVRLRMIVDNLNAVVPETDENNREHEAALLKAQEQYTRAEVLYHDTRTAIFEDIASYPERQRVILAGDDAFSQLFASDPAEIFEKLLGEGWDPYTFAFARISGAIHGTQTIVKQYVEASAGSVDSAEIKVARELFSQELNQFVGEDDPTRQRANATLQINALVGGGAQISEIVATLQVREAIAILQVYETVGEVDPALMAKATRFSPLNGDAEAGKQAALQKIIGFAAQGHEIAQTFMLTRLKGHESLNQLSQTLSMVRAFKRIAQGG